MPDTRKGLAGHSVLFQPREARPFPTTMRITWTCGLDADGRRVVGIFSSEILAHFVESFLGSVVLSDYCDSPLAPAE